MYSKINKIHLIGIGGIGMSGIAQILLQHGYQVSGSDVSQGEQCRELARIGVTLFSKHVAENVEGVDLVVFSSAIRPENPEFATAVSRGIPLIPRAEMLAELMRLKYGIAVAGAHGKTTTTSMIGLTLTQGGLDPTIVVGGRMDNFGGTNARSGRGKFMVVEADESDGSFNRLSPAIAVVTNIDREHMDHYQTMARLKKSFVSFMNKVPFYGTSIVCGDDPYLKMLLPQVTRRKITYGFSEGNRYQVTSYETSGDRCKAAVTEGTSRFTISLSFPGKHNILNAVATVAVADELGIDRNISLEALGAFQGVQRRFHKRGEKDGVILIDDYAHHPTEIQATLKAARERFPRSKIRVVFQPHRYSRVEDLFDRFSTCFNQCDSIGITDIYSAGESPRPGISGTSLSENISRTGHKDAFHVSQPLETIEEWLEDSEPGDVIMTLGAGDLPNVYRQIF